MSLELPELRQVEAETASPRRSLKELMRQRRLTYQYCYGANGAEKIVSGNFNFPFESWRDSALNIEKSKLISLWEGGGSLLSQPQTEKRKKTKLGSLLLCWTNFLSYFCSHLHAETEDLSFLGNCSFLGSGRETAEISRQTGNGRRSQWGWTQVRQARRRRGPEAWKCG